MYNEGLHAGVGLYVGVNVIMIYIVHNMLLNEDGGKLSQYTNVMITDMFS